MTGVDASVRNIHAALKHASHDPLVASRVTYKCVTVEELAKKEPGAYDCVIASEVIEHVSNKDTFISASLQLTKVSSNKTLTKHFPSLLLLLSLFIDYYEKNHSNSS